jgi:hypothetical protein
MQMMMRRSDRRFAQRFILAVPLHIRGWHSSAPEQKAASVNLSESGVYFETDAAPREGAAVQVKIAMPREITGNPTTEWRCMGKVVRVSSITPGVTLGVAVRFDYYEVS